MRFLADVPEEISDVVPTQVYALMKVGSVKLARVDTTDEGEMAEVAAYCQRHQMLSLIIVDNEPENGYALLRPLTIAGD